ncbi:DUF6414 family protein [Aestuariimicrobium sp. T2.26MG-19.2B]|uniref:DUF6414 family protein n=1 Tax=Aestuariimicrobium sp. T2.26MG-19.2B TaxID=3040679 RepID=UPI0025418A0C|nr:hypothetical protein [Aestuariimicrobium sp. T2.26MG-19.2B]
MLINPQYLNSESLLRYMANLEDGVRESGEETVTAVRDARAGVDVKVARAEGGRGSQTARRINTTDHDLARLKRLIAAGHERSDELDWIEILQPAIEFPMASIGSIIEWDCEIFVPDVIRAMLNKGGFSEAVRALQRLRPAADVLGLGDLDGINFAEIDAAASFLETLDVVPVVVGEDDETEWKVVGSLEPRWISGDQEFDGAVKIIGKIRKIVKADRWYPLMSLPGQNLGSRADKRERERRGPASEEAQEHFLKGPLMVLDYLVIHT